jgi:LysR family transcriptional regulator of abg operon
MKLHQFRNIAAIAERGSLRAAARHLGLAQPALSRSLQELEHELGVQLFERRARGMTPTPVGEAFVRRANNIMTEVRRAKEEVEQLHGGASGSVTAAMSIVPHLAIVPQALRPFRARYPDVELRLIEGLYPMIESDLKDGMLDFYVGPPPEQNLPAELMVEKVFDNERKIFCRKGHPLAGAKALRELVGAEWLTTSITYNAEQELGELFVRNRLPMPRLALRSQSALTMIVSPTVTCWPWCQSNGPRSRSPRTRLSPSISAKPWSRRRRSSSSSARACRSLQRLSFWSISSGGTGPAPASTGPPDPKCIARAMLQPRQDRPRPRRGEPVETFNTVLWARAPGRAGHTLC